MLAPCGMNCSFCYVHHKKKKPCSGCRSTNGNKPKSCRNCRIKDCISSRYYTYCSECDDYPCTLIKNLDRSYRTRYTESLIDNLSEISKKGADCFIEAQKKKYTCPDCGNYLNMHDKLCYGCYKKE